MRRKKELDEMPVQMDLILKDILLALLSNPQVFNGNQSGLTEAALIKKAVHLRQLLVDEKLAEPAADFVSN